mgnify:CR=1 FL=1
MTPTLRHQVRYTQTCVCRQSDNVGTGDASPKVNGSAMVKIALHPGAFADPACVAPSDA